MLSFKAEGFSLVLTEQIAECCYSERAKIKKNISPGPLGGNHGKVGLCG